MLLGNEVDSLSDDSLLLPPRRRNEGIISPLLRERTAIAGLLMAIGTLAIFPWELDRGPSLEAARTAALTTMVLFQAFHLGNVRSERQSAFTRNPLLNPLLSVGTVAPLGLHILALYLPPTRFVLRVEPLDLESWARITAVAATIILAIELHKLAVRGRGPLHRSLLR